MSTKCSAFTEMEKRLLSEDRPIRPTPADLSHAKSCPECAAFLETLKGFESDMTAGVNETWKHLPPVAFNPPSGGPGSGFPRWLLFLFFLLDAVIVAGVVWYFAWYKPSVQPPPSRPMVVAALHLESGTIAAAGETLVAPAEITPGPKEWRITDPVRMTFREKVCFKSESAVFGYTEEGLKLKSGKMSVALPGKGFPFNMSTPHACLGVRGTMFDVAVSAAGTLVNVQEGAVWVRGNSEKGERVVSASETIEIASSGMFLSAIQVRSLPVKIATTSVLVATFSMLVATSSPVIATGPAIMQYQASESSVIIPTSTVDLATESIEPVSQIPTTTITESEDASAPETLGDSMKGF